MSTGKNMVLCLLLGLSLLLSGLGTVHAQSAPADTLENISKFAVTPKVKAGEDLHFQFYWTGQKATFIILWLTNEEKGKRFEVVIQPKDGFAYYTMKTNRYIAAGTWMFTQMTVYYGGDVQKDFNIAEKKLTFEIQNDTEDLILPIGSDFRVQQEADKYFVYFKGSDDLSGLSTVEVYFRNDSGPTNYFGFITDLTEEHKVGTNEYRLVDYYQKGLASGIWWLDFVRLWDAAGNESEYYRSDGSLHTSGINYFTNGIGKYEIEQFIKRGYYHTLFRNPDTEGLNWWVDQVMNKKVSAAHFIGYVLLDSKEFTGKKISDEEFIQICYRVFFNRAADESGLKHWMGKIKEGYSRRWVVASFIDAPSGEFQNICNQYVMNKGKITVYKSDMP